MIPFDFASTGSGAPFPEVNLPTLHQQIQYSPFDLNSAGPPPLCIPAISCSLDRVPNLDTCCINAPSGHFLATQFWDTQPALGANDTWTLHGLWPDYCTGGFDAFCNSSRALSGPDIERIIADADTNGTHPGLLDFMNQFWQSKYESSYLWAHEWNKHGTCISTLEPNCYDNDQQKPNPPDLIDAIDVLDYFTHASLLFNSLPTFQFFADHDIVPSHDQTYALEQLQDAIRSSPHGLEATIHCRNHNELSEIWYHFNTRGSLRNAMDSWWDGNKMWSSWLPTEPDGQVCRCPKEGIRYLPKSPDWHDQPSKPITSTQTTTQTTTAAPTSTGAPSTRPFVGKGRLMVKVLHNPDLASESDTPLHTNPTNDESTKMVPSPIPHPYTGCLIRHGTWYAARSLTSCAIFTASDDVKTSSDDENYHLFTLASRFAPCSFVPSSSSSSSSSSYFSCSRELHFQTIFSNNATVDEQHTEDARRLTVGREHVGVFWARGLPRGNGKEVLWRGDEGEDENELGIGKGAEEVKEKGVKVEVYWVGVE